MHAAKLFPLLALIGATIAHPHRRANGGHKKVVYETVVKTVYETVTFSQPQPTPAPVSVKVSAPPLAPIEASAPAPAPILTSVVSVPKPAPIVPTSTAVPVVVPAPKPVVSEIKPVVSEIKPVVPESKSAVTSASQPVVIVTPTPTSTVVTTPAATAVPASGYMAIVDEWCVKLGRPKFNEKATLVANAIKTAREGNGEMHHQLNPGSFGQTLAPGGPNDFLHVFVGGWLCERATLTGLGNVCQTQSKGWTYGGQTGHADIIMNRDYHSIGCGQSGGIWSCDFAFDA